MFLKKDAKNAENMPSFVTDILTWSLECINNR